MRRLFIVFVLLITACAQRESPRPATQTFARADALFAKKDFAGALDAYMDAVKADPAAANLGAIGRYAGRDELQARTEGTRTREVAALRQYLQIHPDDVEARKQLMGAIDLPEAEAMLAPELQSRPRDPELYTTRGTLRRYHKSYSGAVDDFVKASELDPQNATRLYSAGSVIYDAVKNDSTLDAAKKQQLIRQGIEILGRAEALQKDYVEAMGYHHELLRQQALLEKNPKTAKKLIAEADEIRARAKEILKKTRG